MINLIKNIYNKLFPMNTVIINGKTYNVSGNNISVQNISGKGNKVIINGVTIVDGLEGNEVTVKWEGDLANLNCTSAIINGDVNGDVDTQSLTCKNITAKKVESQSIDCADIYGDVDSQSVTCNNVTGDIDAMSVTCKK